ncbi:MAG: Gfo/Idh/MocA family oxidoreductase [Planctomycetia bacterium]|nr:Gfo/Idh/MocA family oxidoreductase [Planctomycetia bacterium]
MNPLNRRRFLGNTALGAAALTLPAQSYAKVLGANEKIGIAFLGTGGRCMESHIKILNIMIGEDKPVRAAGVCDVWDGNKEVGRGLYPAAEALKINPDDKSKVTKNYQQLLDSKEVDVVCICTPDHWHAKMSIDAMAAGKDVYCEKPMTRTIEESHAVVDASKKYNRVMSVGVQSMANPIWRMANEYIRAGNIGHVAQAQTSYFRNSALGQWRYYKLTRDMNPKTIDWDMFLGYKYDVNGVAIGPKPEQQPFDRAVYGQWRCYWPFGGGMFTDLFVHQTTHMIAAMGVRYPARVTGSGGIYLEYDERDVPDVATVVADYDEGCQLIITATMINDYAIDEVIRGRMGTLKFVRKNNIMGYEILPQNLGKGGPAAPKAKSEEGGNFVASPMDDAGPKRKYSYNTDTYALWEDFLDCCRGRKRETLSSAELGAAAFTTVNLGVQSYRQGHVMFWNKELRKPMEGNGSWASNWEKRSKARGKPNEVMGYQGDPKGSILFPPEYQKLGGAWTNGQDPAGA